jgi:PAS domain S-box-containing protein
LALYPWHIIVLAAFCAIVTLLIVWLLIQRSRHGRAKASLRTSEERYLLALAGSTDGLWDWDLLSDSVFFSDRFREILGYSSEEFPSRIDSFRSRLHPEDAEVIWAAIERHLQDRVPYRVEYRLQTNSGDYRWFLAGGQAIWNSIGKAIRMFGSIQDITERKQGELNLKAALSEIKELKEKLEVERAYLQEEIKSQYNHENIIGQSNALNYIFYKVEQIAPTDESIPLSVMNALQDYHWPGNIRELENVLERAVINSSGPKLHLVDELKKPPKDLTTAKKTLNEVERDYIVRVLEQTNWKVSGKNGAAEILGLNRSTLRARMRKLGIRQP